MSNRDMLTKKIHSIIFLASYVILLKYFVALSDTGFYFFSSAPSTLFDLNGP